LQPSTVSKAEFSRLAGVTAGRVSQWISSGELSGDALVRDGRAERINVAVARRQLGRRLAADQRLPAERGGSADRGDTLNLIQRQRLTALELANERIRAEDMARSGRLVEAGAMRAEVGRVAGRLISAFDGVVGELAAAAAAVTGSPERDILHALRGAWSVARGRLAGVEAEAAASLPETVE
jgi:hypothetical protein